MPPAETSPVSVRTDADAAPTARYWSTQPDGRILCTLCPRYCRMADGQAGFCFIRQNHGGKLVQLGYGRSTGFAIDPIEKKPLNHFYPGTPVLSFGTAGCNLGCKFCQNWDISKAKLDEQGLRRNTPDEVVDLRGRAGRAVDRLHLQRPGRSGPSTSSTSRARRGGAASRTSWSPPATSPTRRAPSCTPTSTPPTSTSRRSPRTSIARRRASHLEPVLETLKWIRHKSDTWLEVTTLLIPGHNDSDDELAAPRRLVRREPGTGRAAALHRVPSRLQDDRPAAPRHPRRCAAPAPSRAPRACATSTWATCTTRTDRRRFARAARGR